jgi:tetratricopeptide (TPR) repeat protein
MLPARRLAFALIAALGVPSAAADTILLKNGRRIVAEKVTEEAGRVVYVTEGGRMVMSLPRSVVERIERDGALPPPKVTPSEAGKAGIGPGDARIAGDPATPQPLSPKEEKEGNDASRLLNEGEELLRQQKYREARDVLQAATALAPDSAAAWKALGRAEYALDRPDNALRSWKESLRIAPDSAVEALVRKAQRETAVEDAYRERGSANLTLRYEGGQIPPDLSRRLLAALESQYAVLTRDFGVSPPETVTVIVYTNRAFHEATHAPEWGGGLFDGKVRVPLQGVEVISPELLSVLRHELTHSFVHFRSRGRAPTWVHEGLGQLEQGYTVGDGAEPLLQLWAARKTFKLKSLEGPFGRLGTGQVIAAYEISLAAVQMLVEKNGFTDIGRLLDRLADGSTTAEALRETFRTDYPGLESDLAAWLRGKGPRH